MLKKLKTLLNPQQQKHYLLLSILSVASSLLQTAGVGAISLFFTILLGGKLPLKIQAVVDNYSLPIIGVGVMGLMALGTLSSAFVTYYGTAISWAQYQDIAGRVLKNYLGRNYEWHLSQNSAKLSKTVISETQNIINGILQQLVLVFVKGSELILIGALLIAVRPLIALVASLSFFIIYGGLYYINRSYIKAQGKLVTEANTKRQRAVNESLGGIGAIKVARLEPFFTESFQEAAAQLSRASARIQYFSLLPKYFIELIIFGGLIFFVVLSHQRGWNTSESIPLLALYGAAAIRLLPGAQQLYFSAASILGNHAQLDSVLESIIDDGAIEKSNSYDKSREQGLEPNTLFRFNSVSYCYPYAITPSLHNLDMTIERGEKIGVVGATGAGKSTLVYLLLDLLKPTQGQILRSSNSDIHHLVAYVPQQLHFIDDSIAANIALGLTSAQRDHKKIEAAAQQARIHDHIKSLPLGYNTKMGEQGISLSGGQRQRIGIARALYRQPALLVLDEASNALDAQTEQEVISSLLEQDLNMVIIAHRISILRGCSRILVFDQGCLIAQGAFERLLKTNHKFQALASADLGVVEAQTAG